MIYDFFFDLKDLTSQSSIDNNLKDSNWHVVKITRLYVFCFENENPRIFFKHFILKKYSVGWIRKNENRKVGLQSMN